MIRHIVSWNFNEEVSNEKKKIIALELKQKFADLENMIDGLSYIDLEINLLPSSNKDIALNTLFTDIESLNNYQDHPAHKAIGEFFKPYLSNRVCIDFVE